MYAFITLLIEHTQTRARIQIQPARTGEGKNESATTGALLHRHKGARSVAVANRVRDQLARAGQLCGAVLFCRRSRGARARSETAHNLRFAPRRKNKHLHATNVV